jgi:hypothetical protein
VKWSERLRRIAEPVLAGTPLVRPAGEAERRAYVENFADEQGHRRVWDAYLLGWVLDVPQPASSEPWLWSWDLLHGHHAGPRSGPPYFAGGEVWALEQETEKELAGLHAWWWVVRGGMTATMGALRESPSSPPEVAEPPPPPPPGAGEAWVMANIQPDNATGRPWGIHAFLCRGGEGEAYGEMMLHNCLVARGKPDLLSAVILLDAARGLEAAGT